MTLRRLAASLTAIAVLLVGCGIAVDRQAERREAQAAQSFPPGGEFIEVEGRRVHYVQAGRGPDLILIHGASGNTRDFTFDFAGRVSDRYRVTVFDRPGLGYTDSNPDYEGPFDARSDGPEAQARLLHAAAERLGLSDEIVLGHSYGGAVAMAWALNHDPAALVVVSGATQPWPGGLNAFWTFAGTSLGGGFMAPLITAFAPDALVQTALAKIFAPQAAPEGYADHIGAPLSLRRPSFRTNAQQVRMLKPHLAAMSPRYPSLDLPVEILHGTADEIVPIDIHSDTLARQISGARLTRLEGIGHMPHHARPDAVTAAIDRAAGRAGLR